MWSCPDKPIPELDILREHVRVLQEAVDDSDMYDIRNTAVYEALNYIERTRPWTKWRITQFRQALENWSPGQLEFCINNLKKSL